MPDGLIFLGLIVLMLLCALGAGLTMDGGDKK